MNPILFGTYSSAAIGVVAVAVACAASAVWNADLERFDPPAHFHERIYGEVQECLEEHGYETHGEPGHITWYIDDRLDDGMRAWWRHGTHAIVLDRDAWLNPRAISHEAVHETMRLHGHVSDVWEDCDISCIGMDCPTDVVGRLFGAP